MNNVCSSSLMTKSRKRLHIKVKLELETLSLYSHMGALMGLIWHLRRLLVIIGLINLVYRDIQRRRKKKMHTSCLFCLYGGCVSVSRSAMPKTNGERVATLYINAFSKSLLTCRDNVIHFYSLF